VSFLGRRIEVYPWVNEKVISLVLRCTVPTVLLDFFTPNNSIVEVLAPRKARTRVNPYSPLKNQVPDPEELIKKKSKWKLVYSGFLKATPKSTENYVS